MASWNFLNQIVLYWNLFQIQVQNLKFLNQTAESKKWPICEIFFQRKFLDVRILLIGRWNKTLTTWITVCWKVWHCSHLDFGNIQPKTLTLSMEFYKNETNVLIRRNYSIENVSGFDSRTRCHMFQIGKLSTCWLVVNSSNLSSFGWRGTWLQ